MGTVNAGNYCSLQNDAKNTERFYLLTSYSQATKWNIQPLGFKLRKQQFI